VGEITQSGGIPHFRPTGAQLGAVHASRDLQPTYAPIDHSEHSGTPPAFERASSGPPTIRLGGNTQSSVRSTTLSEDENMKWTKPEAEIVAVTMEVTAYVATL
jgi:coenzyme PQQ precursor peptide PqqA